MIMNQINIREYFAQQVAVGRDLLIRDEMVRAFDEAGISNDLNDQEVVTVLRKHRTAPTAAVVIDGRGEGSEGGYSAVDFCDLCSYVYSLKYGAQLPSQQSPLLSRLRRAHKKWRK